MLFYHSNLFCQSETGVLDEIIEIRLESIIQSDEASSANDEYLIEIWKHYYRNPIVLDGQCENKLTELNLLSDIQIKQIMEHIEDYGSLSAVEELLQIRSMDHRSIRIIQPFVLCKNSALGTRNEIDRKVHHRLRSRYIRNIPLSNGYKGEKAFLGSPDALYTQYRLLKTKKIEAGFSIEKDAGEPLDPLKPQQIDYKSAYLSLRDIRKINHLIIGDFKASFGQGLTFSNEGGMGKSSAVMLVGKSSNHVRPYSSISENQGLRGGLIQTKFKAFTITSFYSKRGLDANIVETEQGPRISSLYSTGLHRTLNEMEKKNAIESKTILVNIEHESKSLSTGLTLVRNSLSLPHITPSEPYKTHAMPANSEFNQGFHFKLNKSNYSLFGEISRSKNAAYAGLLGLMIMPDPQISISFLVRNYGTAYRPISSNAFGEHSLNQNEVGIYMGAKWEVRNKTHLLGYVDVFQFPWLRYQVSLPSKGIDYLLQLEHEIERGKDFTIRFKWKEFMKDETVQDLALSKTQKWTKSSMRLQLQHQVTSSIRMRSRMEFSGFKMGSNLSRGSLLFQEIKCVFERIHFSILGRFTIFNTVDYTTRIYAYEQDLEGLYQIPAFSGTGSRLMFLLKYKFFRHHSIEFKIGYSVYNNIQSIGSGLDEIPGDSKTQLKFQYQLKL